MAVSVSGCADADKLMTNAAHDIGAVADRNLEVIRSLEKRGVISSSTANTYKIAIETKKQEYIDLLSPNVSSEGTSEEVEARKKNKGERLKKAQTQLNSALVYSLGVDADKNQKGVVNGPISGCVDNHIRNHLIGKTDSELSGEWTNYSGTYLTKAHGDSGVDETQALYFLEPGQMGQLLEELNRNIWVLNPETLKTKEEMVQFLNVLNTVKNGTASGTVTRAEQQALMKYFKEINGLKIYNLTSELGQENSILALSTDNSDYIGRMGDGSMNKINKDVVVTAPVEVRKHETRTEPGPPPTEYCDIEDGINVSVGVYTFRVVEFKENFIDGLNQEVFTTNQYINVYPEQSTSVATGQSNEVGCALLMEYPVMAIDGLSSPSEDSSDWSFQYLDYESTNMRINLYTGEMLVKDDSGNWVTANKIEDAADRLYRVLPDNLGYIAEKQNTISFIPSTESVTLSSGEVVGQSNSYDKVKILKPKVDNEDTSVLEDKFEINLKDIFPEYFLKRVGYSIRDIGNNIYEISVYPDGDKAQLKAKKYETTNSVITKELCSNIDTWDKVWELYDKYAAKIKEKSNKDFGDKTNFPIYKIYDKMQSENKFYNGDNQLRSNFSLAMIYNAFMDYFTEDGTNYLLDAMGNEYDKLWLEHIQNPTSFEFEEDGVTYDYSVVYDCTSDAVREAIRAHISTLGSEYEEMYEKMCTYPGYECLGFGYMPKTLFKFEEVKDTILNDANCGKEIDLTDTNRSNLKYDSASRRWEFEYGGKTYIVTPMTTSNTVTDARNITTVQFILTDYLELTYMPGVISDPNDEPFIATGRRVCFDKFSGTGNEVIGYYANKFGDPILNGSGEKIEVRVSDIVDRGSGVDYYEGIAKGLAFEAFKNESRVRDELAKGSGERADRLKSIFTSGSTDGTEEDTGLVQDKSMFVNTVYETTLKPVLQFTSVGGLDFPSLDAMDVNSSAIQPSMYYGMCLNTNAFSTGLYTDWIEAKADSDDGSLTWWNTWLNTHGYKYQIDITRLKQVMSGFYAISLADMEGTITFNTDTLKVINKELAEDEETETKSLIKTAQVIIGILLLVYGFFMMACWLIDTNLVNGPGFLTIITFGKYVAIRDASEVPRMVDGKIYTDFKYLCVLTVLFTAMGIILVLFDIQAIWAVVNNLFSSGIAIFKDIMLNR